MEETVKQIVSILSHPSCVLCVCVCVSRVCVKSDSATSWTSSSTPSILACSEKMPLPCFAPKSIWPQPTKYVVPSGFPHTRGFIMRNSAWPRFNKAHAARRGLLEDLLSTLQPRIPEQPPGVLKPHHAACLSHVARVGNVTTVRRQLWSHELAAPTSGACQSLSKKRGAQNSLAETPTAVPALSAAVSLHPSRKKLALTCEKARGLISWAGIRFCLLVCFCSLGSRSYAFKGAMHAGRVIVGARSPLLSPDQPC